MTNNFKQLRLPISKRYVDSISALLTKFGALSITLEENKNQPIYQSAEEQTKLWDFMHLVALFAADVKQIAIMSALQNSYSDKLVAEAQWEDIIEEDWLNKWKEDLKPLCFADKLWVCPSWCEVPDPKAINIILDPEMAFGTGNHQTTALCLDWLVNNPPTNQTVLDFGCGSGILAIAAAKLGAAEIYAVDIDQTALEVCAANAQKNNAIISTFLTNKLPEINVDLLLANILAQPLLELSPLLATLVKPGSTIVLSGILANQVEQIMQCYATWCEDFVVTQRDEWVRIVAKSKVALN